MRFWEQIKQKKEEQTANGTYIPRIFEGVDLHIRQNHEKFRFAQLPFSSQLWIFMLHFGKWGFIIIFPIAIISHIAVARVSIETWQQVTVELLIGLYPLLFGIPLLCWLAGHIVINYFPKMWFRPPKGPLWELNRRTGLVTIFGYKRFKKEGVIEEFVAPFYEFDAYMITTVDRNGPSHGLLLRHRYEDRKINFYSLLSPDDCRQRPCALWDFFQNYMDVSGPLPDIPLFEPYRHLDPVTAKYDKAKSRNPRYWIDMNDEAFKAEVNAMWKRIYKINTFSRANLMARYVDFSG
ncbi:hypothetical protein KDX38_28585 [Pseudomonas sp. CDFA 602]|uniref:hypothetical protein n=1 Tax=Pseudomonas californiensis TaxID=2829823 RepID=UPI001E2B5842|nr:hypothetical protein [Pseudomonas californiensis]MCD5997501.1 hypothetical protein [Pseudomonas californiensis]MCD6003111.1 hypothetical protein [Pseudomonas californiensis]